MRRSSSLGLGTAVVLALGACGSAAMDAPEGTAELGVTGQALIVDGTSSLDELSSTPTIYSAVAGVSSPTQLAEISRLAPMGYTPMSLGINRFAAGNTTYSTVFHKNSNVEDAQVRRILSTETFASTKAELVAKGYRLIDLVGRHTNNGTRFDTLWVKEKTVLPFDERTEVTLNGLGAAITGNAMFGYRPIRIHGYTTGPGIRYSVVFVKDALGTDYRVIAEQNSTTYASLLAQHIADGYMPVDQSAYLVGSELRYTGIFVRDPSVTEYGTYRNMTAEKYEERRLDFAKKGFVMVDVEAYPKNSTTLEQQFAATWLRRVPDGVVSNLDLENSANWPEDAKNALIRLKLWAGDEDGFFDFEGRVGFLVEDLTNGNYLGKRVNEPFYLASSSKVLIAAQVLDNLDKDNGPNTMGLELDTNIWYDDTFFRETGDMPNVEGYYKISQSLMWMLQNSSTNATDRLVELKGEGATNAFLRQKGVVDVGDITSICELDKRIFETQSACVRTMSCQAFEYWHRHNIQPASEADRTCVNGLTENHPLTHDRYYSTFANSITPLEQAKFWRALMEGKILSATRRDQMLGFMSDAGYADGLVGVQFDTQRSKGGSKYLVRTTTGVGIDQGVTDDQDSAEYSFTVFTENYESNSDAEARIEAIAKAAIETLAAMRIGTSTPGPVPPNTK